MGVCLFVLFGSFCDIVSKRLCSNLVFKRREDLSAVYCGGERGRRMACQPLSFACLHMVVMHGMVQTSE